MSWCVSLKYGRIHDHLLNYDRYIIGIVRVSVYCIAIHKQKIHLPLSYPLIFVMSQIYSAPIAYYMESMCWQQVNEETFCSRERVGSCHPKGKEGRGQSVHQAWSSGKGTRKPLCSLQTDGYERLLSVVLPVVDQSSISVSVCFSIKGEWILKYYV